MTSNYDNYIDTQRRNLAWILAIAVALMLTFAAVLVVLNREAKFAKKEIEVTLEEIEGSTLEFGSTALKSLIHYEATVQERLEEEWERMRVIADTFKGQSPRLATLTSDKKGRIDFKVALFEAQTRLQELADQQGIGMPDSIGVDETIGEDEEVDMRSLQLASVMLLVETPVAEGVTEIRDIAALEPQSFPLLADENAVVLEFPVRMSFRASFDTMTTMLRRFGEGNPFMAIRSFSGKKIDLRTDEPLQFDVVMAAVHFQFRDSADDTSVSADGGDS